MSTPVASRGSARISRGAQKKGTSGEGLALGGGAKGQEILQSPIDRNEVRSTFNLWSTLLAETRKLSRERASLAETMASEMVARLEIMAKDVNVLTKKVHNF